MCCSLGTEISNVPGVAEAPHLLIAKILKSMVEAQPRTAEPEDEMRDGTATEDEKWQMVLEAK